MTAAYRAYARQQAQAYGINPDVIERQIDQESGFNPSVTSPSGAQGISQFMPGTATSVGLSNPYDPYASIDAMVQLMARYLNDYGSYENALIAYNWGPGNVGRADLPRETQTYLNNILGANMQEPMSTYNSNGGGGGTANGFDTQTFLNGVLSAMPKPGQYKDVTDASGTYTAAQQYQDDYGVWLENYQQALTIAQAQEELGAGLTRMQDGTIVSQADFAMLDPQAQAQVQARQGQMQIDLDNAWSDIVNKYGLTEFQTKQGAIESENQRRSTDFQNRMSEFDTRLGLDQMNQDTAAKQVDRQIAGMQESRGRAGLIQDAMDKAAGWATSGGKTSFTPADLGEAMKVIAQFGGIGANAPFLNFTGTRTIDPQALLTAQDEALGVTGQLPQIPNLLTQPGQIPQAPGTMPVPVTPPQLLYPQAPAQMPVSQQPRRARTLSEILGMPGF